MYLPIGIKAWSCSLPSVSAGRCGQFPSYYNQSPCRSGVEAVNHVCTLASHSRKQDHGRVCACLTAVASLYRWGRLTFLNVSSTPRRDAQWSQRATPTWKWQFLFYCGWHPAYSRPPLGRVGRTLSSVHSPHGHTRRAARQQVGRWHLCHEDHSRLLRTRKLWISP